MTRTATDHPLTALETHLQRAHASVDQAVGRTSGVGHSALLELRADLARLLTRAERIRLFEGEGRK